MNDQKQSQSPEAKGLGLRPPRSSRHRYLKFVADYKLGRLDALLEGEGEDKQEGNQTDDKPVESKRGWQEAIGLKRGKRREYLREYLAWLWPYRYAVIVLAVLALLTAALEMAEPLFMRFIVDRV